MESRSLKIFIACAIGAGIGTLIALEVHQYFWWVGVIAGGLIGYISYEFKGVVSACIQAYYEVVSFKPDRDNITRRFWMTLSIGSMIVSIFAFTGLVYLVATHVLWVESGKTIPDYSFLLLFSYNIPFTPLLWRVMDEFKGKHKDNTLTSLTRWKKTLRFTNPIAVLIYWPYVSLKAISLYILKMIQKLPAFVGKWAPILGSFAKRVFILIHSEARLICGVDASLGAMAGYFYGSVLVGIVVGGILGIINYEVVSKHWLKVVPK